MARRCNDAHQNSQIQLQQELYEANRALRVAYEKFNYVSEAELVEASIYEISSLKAKYSYLLRKVKELSAPQVTEDEAYVAAAAMKGGNVCPS